MSSDSLVLKKDTKAHPQRGANYHDQALDFIDTFPISTGKDTTKITNEDFDRWAHQKGYLNVPFGAATSSDVWSKHLQNRHRLREGIRLAGTHLPRMRESNRPCFTINYLGGDLYEVISPAEKFRGDDLTKKLHSAVEKSAQISKYILQGIDFSAISPMDDQTFAYMIDNKNNAMEDLLHCAVRYNQTKLLLLKHYERYLESQGQPVPSDLRRLLDNTEEESEPNNE